MKYNNFLQKQYNNFAKSFEQKANLEEGNLISKKDFYSLINNLLKDKKILDVGCGDGTDLEYYRNFTKGVFGIDSSEELIDIAKSKIDSNRLKVGHFGNIPFEDNFFDVVLSKYALQTTEDVLPFLKESYRVLKTGGNLIFLVVHPFRQYMEKGKGFKNYFERTVVDSHLFNKTITVKEPTHTMQDYFSKDFFNLFELIDFKEGYDFPASECVDGNIYPTYMIVKARKK